ncbi:capsular polysaccharide synthesis protein [Acinetobacter parvus]|uniref:capsular polysaccharide synthesis protein n=1 Tax=Acinetobacter parvus TaxID=134533 RepID=UPI003919D035
MVNKNKKSSLDLNNISNLFSSEANFTYFIRILHKQPFRIFYLAFIPKIIRRNLYIKANKLQKQHVAQCWYSFLEYYFSDGLEKFQLKAKKKFTDQKIIWQYWGQGVHQDLPDMVRLCFSSVDRYKADYQIIRLDENNIEDYLELPDFVWEKKKNPKFKHAFFADLIRLALLDVYGGVWIDTTVLLTAPIDKEILEYDYFMFQRSQEADNKEFWHQFQHDYFDWSEEQCVNILNSFIVGKKGNNVIHTCLDILLNFWKTQNNIPHYFFFQIMFDVLMRGRFKEYQCPIIDDTLPHLLQSRINTQFNEDDFNSILCRINIHKMTYINKVENNSYYSYLRNYFLLD